MGTWAPYAYLRVPSSKHDQKKKGVMDLGTFSGLVSGSLFN